MKKILKGLAALVVVLVVLLLIHPLWIGPVARTAVSYFVPKYLGVPAKIDGFSLNAYTGRLSIDGFVLANPPECGTENFVSLGSVRVGVNPTSLFTDLIVVDEISVQDFFISFMSDRSQSLRYNFMIVSEYAGGGKKSEADAKPAARQEATKQDEARKPKKVVIDRLQIRNSVVKWNSAAFPLPSFVLTGIGRSTSGLAIDEARREIRRQYFKQLGPLARGLETLLETTDGFFGAGADALRALPGVNGTTTPVRNAGAKVLDDTKKVLDGTTKAGARILESTSGTVDKSVDALKSLFGK